MRLKRKIPPINSSSSADIAFLLLIFFLLTSSLEKEKAFSGSLPEKKTESGKAKEVQERDVFELTINADNSLLYRGEKITPKELNKAAALFISNPYDDIHLPEKFETDVPGFGKYRITENHLFLIHISREAQYQTYIAVQNEINAAYNELRNNLSFQKWGKRYAELPADLQNAVMQIYPYKISETELISKNKQ